MFETHLIDNTLGFFKKNLNTFDNPFVYNINDLEQNNDEYYYDYNTNSNIKLKDLIYSDSFVNNENIEHSMEYGQTSSIDVNGKIGNYIVKSKNDIYNITPYDIKYENNKNAKITITSFCSGNYSYDIMNANNNDKLLTLNISSTLDDSDFIDLGLPSGTKWANFCLGSSVENNTITRYYQIGMTTDKSNINKDIVGKLPKNSEWINDEYYGGTRFDVARLILQGSCRTPSKSEWQELFSNTTIIQNTSQYIKLQSKINNEIYFIYKKGYFELRFPDRLCNNELGYYAYSNWKKSTNGYDIYSGILKINRAESTNPIEYVDEYCIIGLYCCPIIPIKDGHVQSKTSYDYDANNNMYGVFDKKTYPNNRQKIEFRCYDHDNVEIRIMNVDKSESQVEYLNQNENWYKDLFEIIREDKYSFTIIRKNSVNKLHIYSQHYISNNKTNIQLYVNLEEPNSFTISNKNAIYGFEYYTNVKLVIDESISQLEDNAFENCSNIKEILICGNNNIKQIGNYVFKGCINVQSVNVTCETPPIIGSHCFDGIDDSSYRILVPYRLLDLYKTSWPEYANKIFEFQ